LAALEKDYEEVGIETAEGEGEEEAWFWNIIFWKKNICLLVFSFVRRNFFVYLKLF
jgi:hypothetical protein